MAPRGKVYVIDDDEARSEERRVGKGVDLGGRRIIKKKKKKENELIDQGEFTGLLDARGGAHRCAVDHRHESDRFVLSAYLDHFVVVYFFFFQAEDGIRDLYVTGVQTCALPISAWLHETTDVAGAHIPNDRWI